MLLLMSICFRKSEVISNDKKAEDVTTDDKFLSSNQELNKKAKPQYPLMLSSTGCWFVVPSYLSHGYWLSASKKVFDGAHERKVG